MSCLVQKSLGLLSLIHPQKHVRLCIRGYLLVLRSWSSVEESEEGFGPNWCFSHWFFLLQLVDYNLHFLQNRCSYCSKKWWSWGCLNFGCIIFSFYFQGNAFLSKMLTFAVWLSTRKLKTRMLTFLSKIQTNKDYKGWINWR